MTRALLATLLLCTGLFAATPAAEHPGQSGSEERSLLAFFVQPSISFLGFDNREKFQAAIDTIYKNYRAQALTASESSYVAKQDFQKVNFCFPVTAGVQVQWLEGHFVSLGAGFIYDNESVVVTDRKDKIHDYSYTLQGVPLFLEYRVAIPSNLVSLSNASLFSIAFRWYWMLPGTEIYSNWGHIEAETSPWGNGFGVSLGYLAATWKNIHIYGDIGYSRIIVKSDEPFSGVVPDTDTDKAKWDLGGLQLQFRFSFGVIHSRQAEE